MSNYEVRYSLFLYKQGCLHAVAVTQYNEEGETQCIFYSANNCHDWETINCGDGIFSRDVAAKIPDKDGVSIIYLESSNTLRIINIRTKDR